MRAPALASLALLSLACSSQPDAEPTSSSGAGGSSSSATGAAGGGGSPALPTGDIDGRVRRYDYAFDLETGVALGRAEVEVAAPGGDCLTVGCELAAVSPVSWNDEPASSVALDGKALRACGRGVGGGEPLELEVGALVPEKTFLGLDVGFSRSPDLAGGTFSYLLSWVGGCDRFGACDDDPAQLVELHFEVTHAPGDVVLCPGTLSAGETRTTCDISGVLAPTYSGFAIASDPLWVRTPFVSAAGVDVVFYEVPGGGIAQALDAASIEAFLTWVTGLLGPMPYGPELRVAGGPTGWLGFEHPANIILAEDLGWAQTSYEDTALHVFMHEVIHQWAGDRTTLASAEDFAWKEAVAEYLSYVFEDEQRPPEEAASSLQYWDTTSLQAAWHPRPTDDPAPKVQAFYGHVYGPGPMVLFVQLETMIGRPAVLSALQALLAEPGARSVADVQAALEQASGEDLSDYFDAWVFGTGKPEWPSFLVETAQVGTEVTVTLTQQNPSGTLYGCAVGVEVQGATESATVLVDFGLAPSAASAQATATLAQPIVGVVLDPEHRVVAKQVTPAASYEPPPELPVWIL